jgi:hypothetical protein
MVLDLGVGLQLTLRKVKQLGLLGAYDQLCERKVEFKVAVLLLIGSKLQDLHL